jgi:o-succinylbenzoate---CoA ligase
VIEIETWLRAQDPKRVFVETGADQLTFGQAVAGLDTGSGPAVMVVRPGLDLDGIVSILAAMTSGTAVLLGPGQTDPGAADTADAATVVFTSGSSGTPKGVRLTAANWAAAARASVEHLGHGSEDVWLLAMPLHHVGGLSIVIRSAYCGGRVRLLPGFDAVSFARALHEGVTMASVVPTMLSRVLDVDSGPYEGLRAVLVGGGPIPPGLLERASEAGLPVLPTYGMTETCGQAATLRPGSPVEYRADPLPGVEIRIEDDGRIAVRGPLVSPGYLGETDRGSDWFVTGDLGEIDPTGSLRVLGRADTTIVTGGENVAPEGVEAALLDVPGVDQVLVVGVPDPEWGIAVAAVYTGSAAQADAETALRRALPGFMVPKRWMRIETIPVTGLGKPDRAAARDLFS